MENSILYDHKPSHRSWALDPLTTSLSTSNFSLTLSLATDPSAVVFLFHF